MSRHPSKSTPPVSRQEKVAEEYINYIATTSTPNALTLATIAEATERDPTLTAVIEAVQTGKWYDLATQSNIDADAFRTYERLKEELAVGTTPRVLLRGTRLVIPTSSSVVSPTWPTKVTKALPKQRPF